jgi:hypothetical protein
MNWFRPSLQTRSQNRAKAKSASAPVFGGVLGDNRVHGSANPPVLRHNARRYVRRNQPCLTHKHLRSNKHSTAMAW